MLPVSLVFHTEVTIQWLTAMLDTFKVPCKKLFLDNFILLIIVCFYVFMFFS